MNEVCRSACTTMAYLFAAYVTGGTIREYVRDNVEDYFRSIDTTLRNGGTETMQEIREIAKTQLETTMGPWRTRSEYVKNNIHRLAKPLDLDMADRWYSEIADEVGEEVKKTVYL